MTSNIARVIHMNKCVVIMWLSIACVVITMRAICHTRTQFFLIQT